MDFGGVASIGQTSRVTEENKTPLEQAVDHALDVFVYAPIGLLFDGAAVFPELVQKGKAQVNSARMFGQFAVQAGQSEAEKRASGAAEQVRDLLASVGIVPPDQASATTPEPAPEPASPPPAAAAKKKAPAESAPAATSLSIPDYDSLSASQVVSRLAGLGAAELEAVRKYEGAQRGRKTILNKIAQLQK